MPILQHERDINPGNLLGDESLLADTSRTWWCLYTLSRREKLLMRRMLATDLAFYGPVAPKRSRSPAGRVRTSFVPLFPNYVFLFADDSGRREALRTNCISRIHHVEAVSDLMADLRRIHAVIEAGVPLMAESRLVTGNRVRVKSGRFKRYEGTVLRREGKSRLLLAINFLEQGVSMEIDEALLEPL